jgi:membrane protease YdiL (CAAX protease family)
MVPGMTDQRATPQEIQPPPVHDFLDLAREGKNEWWRYLVAIAGITILTLVIATYFAIITGDFGLRFGGYPLADYIIGNLGFVALMMSMFVVVRVVHRRRFRTLITPWPRISWLRILIGFGLWIFLSAVVALVDYLLRPEIYQLSSNLPDMLLPALVVLVLTPIQTTTEELLFCGYLLQGLALLTRNSVILVMASGLLFMLAHLANPEVSAGLVPMMLSYAGFGILVAMVTIRTQGLELAIGVHAGNNLFSALIANYKDLALETASIFFINELDATYSLVSFIIAAYTLYIAIDRIAPRSTRAVSRSDAA